MAGDPEPAMWMTPQLDTSSNNVEAVTHISNNSETFPNSLCDDTIKSTEDHKVRDEVDCEKDFHECFDNWWEEGIHELNQDSCDMKYHYETSFALESEKLPRNGTIYKNNLNKNPFKESTSSCEMKPGDGGEIFIEEGLRGVLTLYFTCLYLGFA